MLNTQRMLELISKCNALIADEQNGGAMDVLEEMAEVIEEEIIAQDALLVVSENAGDVVDLRNVSRCEHGFSDFRDCASCILDASVPL